MPAWNEASVSAALHGAPDGKARIEFWRQAADMAGDWHGRLRERHGRPMGRSRYMRLRNRLRFRLGRIGRKGAGLDV